MQSYLPNQNKANAHFANSSHFNSFNQGSALAGLGAAKRGFSNVESPEESGDITMGGINAIKSLDRH